MDNVTITRNDERYRYEITVGIEVVGFSKFRDADGRRTFTHTEIDASHQGHGLATKLIRWALDDTRQAGLRLVPACPMVAAFVGKNTEYDDIVDWDTVPPV